MASGAELIRKAKEQITEVDPREVHDLIRQRRNGTVRRRRARAARVRGVPPPGRRARAPRTPGVAHRERRQARRPRGPLLRVGQPLGARRQDAPGGARLRGRRVDDRRHHALEGPRLRRRDAAQAHRRAARALLAPPAGARDRPRGPAQAAGRQGAAAGRRRPGLADRALPRRRRRGHARASSTTTSSTSPTSSARSSTPPTASARPRSTRPSAPSRTSTRTWRS